MIEDDFRENLSVKQIQAPRPEPNQIDQKNRQHDQHEGDNPEKPFQDALKHGLTCSRLIDGRSNQNSHLGERSRLGSARGSRALFGASPKNLTHSDNPT